MQMSHIFEGTVRNKGCSKSVLVLDVHNEITENTYPSCFYCLFNYRKKWTTEQQITMNLNGKI